MTLLCGLIRVAENVLAGHNNPRSWTFIFIDFAMSVTNLQYSQNFGIFPYLLFCCPSLWHEKSLGPSLPTPCFDSGFWLFYLESVWQQSTCALLLCFCLCLYFVEAYHIILVRRYCLLLPLLSLAPLHFCEMELACLAIRSVV